MGTRVSIEGTTRELARRVSDGIEVSLLWHGGDDVTVLVYDARTGESFESVVDPSRAREAFYHPFGFATISSRRPLVSC